jgi:L-2,4-diaminobutyrate decarboxylase
MPRYRRLLSSLREAFPAPVSNPVHDGCLSFSMLRALDQVDRLKSQAPILGDPREPDFESAGQARIAEDGLTLEAVMPLLVECLVRCYSRRQCQAKAERPECRWLATSQKVCKPAPRR